MEKLLKKDLKTEDKKEQSYLTSHNKYVSRFAAFKIAKENNQICDIMYENIDEGDLISDDLY